MMTHLTCHRAQGSLHTKVGIHVSPCLKNFESESGVFENSE